MLKREDDIGGVGYEKITLPTDAEGKTNFPPAHADLDANDLALNMPNFSSLVFPSHGQEPCCHCRFHN